MDKEGIHQYRLGQEDAFVRLYESTYDQVYRFVFHRVLDHVFCEDIISEVYLKVYKNHGKCRAESKGELMSWLYRIAYTTLIDHVRYQSPLINLDELTWEVSGQNDYGNHIDAKEHIDRVIAYLSTLSEREKAIFTMRIWDDMAYADISKILSISINNTKKIFSRTLAKVHSNVPVLSLVLCLIPHVF